MNNYKITAIQMFNNLYFICKHTESKYHNNFTNEIITLEQLLEELHGYSNNDIIYLEDVLLLKDINNNIINYDDLYLSLDSLIIADKLIDNKLLLININNYKFLIINERNEML